MLKTQKTTLVKPAEHKPAWWLVDLKDKTLGRAATQIADLLRGKHRPTYTPQWDLGDFVVAINAAGIKLTGQKWSKKMYYRHSGFRGGFRQQTAGELIKKHPEDLIVKAVKGMLPKNFLAQKILTKLKVYPGTEHPHEAQQPKVRELH
ncbi:MAG: 50S ribosomal protein L13 [Deltaproteobacteria bacterium]|nr:50S ribosomal protein L13 [Deltaproteobacteria bacterium]MBI4224588.1 50S ribosomal protein L13 [Deltaproteobacteria bacterium]